MKTYKLFLKNIFLTFVLSAFLIFSLLIGIGYVFVGKYAYTKGAQNIKYWIDVKNDRATKLSKKGSKIILLSGSNTLHGFDSKYVEEKLNLPVLNYGIHAAFGPYIFQQVKEIANPNDIIVLPLEFIYYNKDNTKSTESPFMEYLISFLPLEYKKANLYDKFVISMFLIQNWICKPTFNYEKNNDISLFTDQINSHGDFVNHIGTTEKFLKLKNPQINITENLPNVSEYKKFPLYNFIQYCKGNNIKLYATLPNHYHSDKYAQKEIIAFEKIKLFYKEQGVDFIGDITASSLNKKEFFNDTAYHTNVEGTKIRTDWLIKNIFSIPEIKNINNKLGS